MKIRLPFMLVLALAACSPKPEAPAKSEANAVAEAPAATPKSTAPVGTYEFDASHTSVVFKVNHLGFSNYTAGFDKVDGKLMFDPQNPAGMSVDASIDPRSLDLNTPPPGFHDELMGPMFFDVAKFPTIRFNSTSVKPTGPATADVTGDFTLHGVTKPVTLAVTFNGGWAANAYDGNRVGFSAKGVLKRADFGISNGIPAPGTTMGVSDAVEFAIETELSNGEKIAPKP